MKRTINRILEYKWAILVYIILIVSLIPLFKLCAVCVPNADDFFYGYKAHKAYVDTGSLMAAISGALERTADTYFTWQGTFTSIFLMSLQPGVFSLELYRVAALVLIITCVVMPAILAISVSKHMLRGSLNIMLCLSGVYSLLTLQFMPSIFEGIYWFNGAWFYTFTFNLFLLWIALIIKFMYHEMKKAAKIITFTVIILIAVFLGGTNYPMVVMLTVLSSMFMAIIFMRKHDKRWFLFIVWVVLGICIAINVFAPGNMGKYREHVNFEYTIFCMIRNFIKQFTTSPSIYLTLSTCCLLIPFSHKIVEKSTIRFVKPVVFIVIAFLALFSMYTPAAFHYHNSGPVRSQNARMMFMQIMIIAGFINYFGYHKNKSKKSYARPALCYVVAILCLMTMPSQSIMDAWS